MVLSLPATTGGSGVWTVTQSDHPKPRQTASQRQSVCMGTVARLAFQRPSSALHPSQIAQEQSRRGNEEHKIWTLLENGPGV